MLHDMTLSMSSNCESLYVVSRMLFVHTFCNTCKVDALIANRLKRILSSKQLAVFYWTDCLVHEVEHNYMEQVVGHMAIHYQVSTKLFVGDICTQLYKGFP